MKAFVCVRVGCVKLVWWLTGRGCFLTFNFQVGRNEAALSYCVLGVSQSTWVQGQGCWDTGIQGLW